MSRGYLFTESSFICFAIVFKKPLLHFYQILLVKTFPLIPNTTALHTREKKPRQVILGDIGTPDLPFELEKIWQPCVRLFCGQPFSVRRSGFTQFYLPMQTNVHAKMIFRVFFFFFAEKDLFSGTETTAQRYLWLYCHAVVKSIPIVFIIQGWAKVTQRYPKMRTREFPSFFFVPNFVGWRMSLQHHCPTTQHSKANEVRHKEE